MPRAEVTGMDGLIRELGRLAERAGAIAERAVDAASPALRDSLARAISESTGPSATGGLAGSIRATKARTNERGAYAVVRPEGRDPDGKRYGERLAYLEYGTRSQAPRPVRARAANAASAECLRRMAEAVREAVEGTADGDP